MGGTAMHACGDALLPRHFGRGVLRRLQPRDLAAFQAYRSIPELGRFQGWTPMSEAHAAAFIVEMGAAPLFAPGEWVQLGIAEPMADRLVGDVGLFVSEDASSAEVGVTLDAAFQGRGIASGAVREALDVLFAATPVRQVSGIVDERNTASIRLLERTGFEYRERRHTVFRGEPCCEMVFVRSRPAR